MEWRAIEGGGEDNVGQDLTASVPGAIVHYVSPVNSIVYTSVTYMYVTGYRLIIITYHHRHGSQMVAPINCICIHTLHRRGSGCYPRNLVLIDGMIYASDTDPERHVPSRQGS